MYDYIYRTRTFSWSLLAPWAAEGTRARPRYSFRERLVPSETKPGLAKLSQEFLPTIKVPAWKSRPERGVWGICLANRGIPG